MFHDKFYGTTVTYAKFCSGAKARPPVSLSLITPAQFLNAPSLEASHLFVAYCYEYMAAICKLHLSFYIFYGIIKASIMMRGTAYGLEGTMRTIAAACGRT